MKTITISALLLAAAAVVVIWLAGGNLSKTDVLNPVTSSAVARRTDAETLVYSRESEIRLNHLDHMLAEEEAHQRAMDQQAIEDARHASQLRDILAVLALGVLAGAIWLPAWTFGYYWFCRAQALLREKTTEPGQDAHSFHNYHPGRNGNGSGSGIHQVHQQEGNHRGH